MALKYFNNLAYEEIGENKSEIILFLHPKLLSHWIWKKQMEEYDKYFNNYHCIFIDIPKHGDSQYDGRFSINESSNMIIDFLIDLIGKKDCNPRNNEKKVNIIAIGLGTSIAIEILNKKPNIINNIILSGTEIAHIREKEEETILNRLAKTKAEYLNLKPDSFIIKAYLRYLGINKEYYSDLEKSLDMPIKNEKEIAYESLNYTVPDLPKETKEKENILIIYGNKDNFNSTKSAIKLKSILPKAKLIEIEKGNHLWNIIDYELFNETVYAFLMEGNILDNERIKIIE